MNDLKVDTNLVASCGLYCGACKAYLKNRCSGCKTNVKAEKWCKVKLCTKDSGFQTCASCKTYTNPNDCKKFNNIFAKIFKLLFGSNRAWCINKIKKTSLQEYANFAVENKNYNGKGQK